MLQEVERALALTPVHTEHSKKTLRRFGNTACASTFYVLASMETVRAWRVCNTHTAASAVRLITPLPQAGIKQGDRLWQMGFGTGYDWKGPARLAGSQQLPGWADSACAPAGSSATLQCAHSASPGCVLKGGLCA